jgi:hypothetical protein
MADGKASGGGKNQGGEGSSGSKQRQAAQGGQGMTTGESPGASKPEKASGKKGQTDGGRNDDADEREDDLGENA